MKVVLSLLFFLLCIPFTSTADTKTREYFTIVNSAELKIVEKNYSYALKLYKHAFRCMRPFAIDVKHALDCAMITGDTSNAIRYCRLLAEKGVGKDYFRTKGFSALSNRKEWQQIIDLAYRRRCRLDKKNKFLIQKLNGLLEIDQQNAIKYRSVNHYSTWRSKIDVIDSVSEALINVFELYGVNREGRLGVAMADDSIIVTNYNYDVMMIHCFQKGSVTNRIKLARLLKRALDKGLITPQSLKILFSMSSAFDSRLDDSRLFVTCNGSLFKKKIENEDWWTIDRIRSEFYLCPLSDLERKAVYNINQSKIKISIGFVPHELNGSFSSDEERSFFNSQFVKVADIQNENK